MKKGIAPIELLLLIMAIGAAIIIGYHFYPMPISATPGTNGAGENGSATSTVFQSTSTSSSTPSASSSTSAIMHCGGFIRNAPSCPAGYHCVFNPALPDRPGSCEPNEKSPQ